MSRRAARLACLLLVLVGIAGTVLTAAGYFPLPPRADGTAFFPLSVVAGIVGLHRLRPGTTPAPHESEDS